MFCLSTQRQAVMWQILHVPKRQFCDRFWLIWFHVGYYIQFYLFWWLQFSLLQYDDDGQLDQSSIIPMVDGGTEGFKGNARVILPGMTACVECTLDLYPPQVTAMGIFAVMAIPYCSCLWWGLNMNSQHSFRLHIALSIRVPVKSRTLVKFEK